MLKNSEPAGFTAFFYPGTEHIVRMHRHTDTDDVWCVAADICALLDLTNVSYVTSRLEPECVYKHRIQTKGGVQTVVWIALSEIIRLCRAHNAGDLVQWLTRTARMLPARPQHCDRVYRDPVIVERETLDRLKQVLSDLCD